MRTERLYYGDSYLSEFDATVVGRGAAGRIYLDRSAFYPTSGGQRFDLGLLCAPGAGGPAQLSVIDVVDEGDAVAHVLAEDDAARLEIGQRVNGRLDWARRFDHMQQHTGQHLLSAVFVEQLGLATLSVHFGADSATLDLDVASLSLEQLRAVEERANAAVFEDRAVTTEIVEAADAAGGLRKQSSRSGPLRVVSIAALDRSACGGTHVARTGEIGPIALRKQERVRKATRVEFLCGARATRRARADYEALARLGGLVSTSPEGAADVVETRLARLERDSAALRAARVSLDQYRASELHARALTEAGDRELALSIETRVEGSLDDLRGLATAYAQRPRAVFVGVLEQPASILLATSEDTGIDAAAVLKGALAASNGRGGGSARLARGSVDGAALGEVLRVLQAHLRPEHVGSN